MELEGRQIEAVKALRLLPRRVGALSDALQKAIRGISLPELRDLNEALLDFKSMDDLLTWLAAHRTG
jgi:hypothetical protein